MLYQNLFFGIWAFIGICIVVFVSILSFIRLYDIIEEGIWRMQDIMKLRKSKRNI